MFGTHAVFLIEIFCSFSVQVFTSQIYNPLSASEKVKRKHLKIGKRFMEIIEVVKTYFTGNIADCPYKLLTGRKVEMAQKYK